MRYNRNLSLNDAAWIQFRIISSLLSNFVYRRKWYSRRARGHINPHKISDAYYKEIAALSVKAAAVYQKLCASSSIPQQQIREDIGQVRVGLYHLKNHLATTNERVQEEFDTDWAKFKSTWKKLDDELQIIEGHKDD